MNYLKIMLMGLLMTCVGASAQTQGVKSSSIRRTGSKLIVNLELTTDGINTNSWSQLAYHITITDGENVKELKTATIRHGQKNPTLKYVDYISYQDWMNRGQLKIKRELLNSKKQVLDSSESSLGFNFVDKDSKSTTLENVSLSTLSGFVGSYVEPIEDAYDKLSQKELYLSLDEMRICANVTPELLTQRQLYQVALSYRPDSPDKFYQTILKTAELFPTSQDAALNAAAVSLERGELDAAGKYLKNARTGSTEFKNVNGVYQIMSGNFGEGIRLLKAAKTDGSEEAASNLDFFFAHYKQFANGKN